MALYLSDRNNNYPRLYKLNNLTKIVDVRRVYT